jgi:hypothetical protein
LILGNADRARLAKPKRDMVLGHPRVGIRPDDHRQSAVEFNQRCPGRKLISVSPSK